MPIPRSHFRHEKARLRICLKEGWAFGCETWGTPREFLVQHTGSQSVVYAGLGVGSSDVVLYYCLPAER